MAKKKTSVAAAAAPAAAPRYRNFGAIVYPESAPANWRAIVADWKIPVFISPLHDRDVDPQDQPKKPHFHVVIAYDAPKKPEQARERFEEIGAVGCEIVQSIRGYCRYLCHLDNPEKAQYSPDDVTTYGGADYADVIGLPTDKYKAIDDMIDYCEQHDIVSFRQLLVYARSDRRDWFRTLCDNGTYVMKEYLKSREWERKISAVRFVDSETGEILDNSPRDKHTRGDMFVDLSQLDDNPF